MQKVRLTLDELQVDSFSVGGAVRRSSGTVRGNATTLCSPEDTCGFSCLDPGSCMGTCMCTADPHC